MRAPYSRLGLIAACVAGGLAAAACASSAPGAPLSDSRWNAASVTGQPVSGPAPTIEFAAGRVSGTGGCNRYFGEYDANADAIVISGLGHTEMACDPNVMRQEAAFFAALQGARSFHRTSDHLMLTASDGTALVFRPAA